MGLPRTRAQLTVTQYLEMERRAPQRHLFLDGEIYAMAGESDAHGIISVNLVVALGQQLRDSPCSLRTKDTKVRSSAVLSSDSSSAGMFSYPDVLVVCGEPEYHDHMRDVLLNPRVTIEVLSESTEAFDRGMKFDRYQTWNPSLTDYLLVSQDKAQIEHFVRQEDNSWSYRRHGGLDAVLSMDSIHCALRLTDVYHRVQLPSPEEA